MTNQHTVITKNNTSISGSFLLDEPIDIKRIETSCGCSVPTFTNNSINYIVTVNSPQNQINSKLYDSGKRSSDKQVIFTVFDINDKLYEFTIKINVNEPNEISN